MVEVYRYVYAHLLPRFRFKNVIIKRSLVKMVNSMENKNYLKTLEQSFVLTLGLALVFATSFFLVEPRVSQAVTSGPFTIKQTVTAEISFLVDASNVTMSGSINGITGGTSNGTTTAVVRTNDPDGYTMSIAFANNGTDNAMLGDTTANESIHDYTASSSEPTYTFHTSSSSAVFAYTASAANTSDLDQSFKDNGAGLCNNSSNDTSGYSTCWMEPSTSGFQIVNRGTDAPTGATTTINFRVHVPNAPSPSLQADTYTATATLTALNI